MELIRVQRELQEKRNNITMTEAQLNQISTSLRATEAANRELVSGIDSAQLDVQEREQQIGRLKAELAAAAPNKLKVISVGLKKRVIDVNVHFLSCCGFFGLQLKRLFVNNAQLLTAVTPITSLFGMLQVTDQLIILYLQFLFPKYF